MLRGWLPGVADDGQTAADTEPNERRVFDRTSGTQGAGLVKY